MITPFRLIIAFAAAIFAADYQPFISRFSLFYIFDFTLTFCLDAISFFTPAASRCHAAFACIRFRDIISAFMMPIDFITPDFFVFSCHLAMNSRWHCRFRCHGFALSFIDCYYASRYCRRDYDAAFRFADSFRAGFRCHFIRYAA